MVKALFAAAMLLHPLHTTLTEIKTTQGGRVQIVIRMFKDDLRKNSPVAYATSHFELSANGKPIELQACGVKETSDLLWVCLQTKAPANLDGLQAHNALFFELFADQVNIVQTIHGTDRHSVLFTPGDRSKRIL